MPPSRPGALADLVRRAVLRTSAGPLRPLWAAAYRLCARATAAYLRGRQPDCAVYALGDPGGPDAVYGVSDIDLAAVAPRLAGRPGERREAILARWERLRRAVPPLGALVGVVVYETPDLERGAACTPSLRPGQPARPPAGRDLSEPIRIAGPPAAVLRAGLGLPPDAWRLLSGPHGLLPPLASADHEPRIAAWLELQHWWHHAFGACLSPRGPHVAHLCVKLVAEPARIWIWLTQGERVSSRREALERAASELPEERETFERALVLQRSLHRSPEPPLAEALAAFLRLSARIEHELRSEVEQAGATRVELAWGGDEELVLPAGTRDRLRSEFRAEPALLPLADWWALTYPGAEPDEAVALVPGSPADPAALARMASAGARGPYPAVRAGGLLVLPAPTARRTRLRAVHCRLSDPVFFALVEGSRAAAFPDVGRWSIREVAAHAAAEHRSWLGRTAGLPQSPDMIARLLGCSRASLLLESVEAGAPRLPLTLRATVTGVGDRHPYAQEVAEESLAAYTGWLEGGDPPAAALAASLRDRVARLPAYR